MPEETRQNRLIEIITAGGGSATEIPRKKGWVLLKAWREIYCAPVPTAKGKRILGGSGGYSWHTFSSNHFPHLAGRKAFREYSAQSASELFVLPERSSIAALRYSNDIPLDFSHLFLDLYVAPSDFAWTMVFTHEEELCGPYFSRAEWGEHRISRD